MSGRRKVKLTHHKEVTQARIKSASPEDSGVYRIKVVSAGDYAIGHIVLNGIFPSFVKRNYVGFIRHQLKISHHEHHEFLMANFLTSSKKLNFFFR